MLAISSEVYQASNLAEAQLSHICDVRGSPCARLPAETDQGRTRQITLLILCDSLSMEILEYTYC
jgi:hypothetical protein